MKNIHMQTRHLLLLVCVLALTACGFHLRGMMQMSFKTLYIQNSGATPLLIRELQRSLAASGVTVVAKPDEAEMLLELMKENTEKRILSLSGGGRVREYELVHQLTLRLRNASNTLWSEPQVIEARRDYSYDDRELLAKEGEEARLYSNMRSDAVREVMRRLNAQQAGKPAGAQ